jgi:hypothetical protein
MDSIESEDWNRFGKIRDKRGRAPQKRRGAHPAQHDFSKHLSRIYIFGKSTMSEFIHEHSTRVKDEDGTTYIVRVYAKSASGDMHKSSTRHALCAQQTQEFRLLLRFP